MAMLLSDNKYFNVEEPDPNDKDFRIYHSRMRLLDDGVQSMAAYKGVTRVGQDQDGEDIPLPGVLEFALQIEGVTWAGLSAYQLTIRKAPIFQWEEIDKKIINLFIGIKPMIDADAT